MECACASLILYEMRVSACVHAAHWSEASTTASQKTALEATILCGTQCCQLEYPFHRTPFSSAPKVTKNEENNGFHRTEKMVHYRIVRTSRCTRFSGL